MGPVQDVAVGPVQSIVLSVGLKVEGESIPYIAGWGETGALDAVTAFAKTIDDLAGRIETALAADPTGQSVAA